MSDGSNGGRILTRASRIPVIGGDFHSCTLLPSPGVWVSRGVWAFVVPLALQTVLPSSSFISVVLVRDNLRLFQRELKRLPV